MKKGILLKIIIIVVFFAGFAGVESYSLLLPQLNRDKPVKTAPALADKLFGWKFPVAKFPLTGSKDKLIAYSSIRDPGGITQGLPVRLKIPSIGVDSAIEDALVTPDGRMDVPAGSVNVAWFALGPHPGAIGSAVIGGHFGITNGIPFVFYRLNAVTIGEKVYIVDDKGSTLAFVVRSIRSFDRNADSTTVFTSSDGLAHLNLITCEGVWNQVNGNYPQRLVVFTDAILSEGAVTIQSPAAVKPILPKTAIATPTSTDTPTKVPPTPTINPKPSAIPISTSTPSSPNNVPISPQTLILSAKSLYATPIDTFITSFLLISIAFITFKIIRR